MRSLVREWRLRFSEGNEVRLFEQGREGLDAMLQAIATAQQRIHLETYILRGDDTGRLFLQALTQRSRAGVRVRLLYDAVGSFGVDESLFRELLESGGDVVVFNPLRRFYPRWAPRRRDHRKVLLVDGRVAFTGGLNIGDEYRGAEDESGWRDTHMCIRGPAVRHLEAIFLESWFRADGPDLDWSEIMSAPLAPAGPVRCAVLPDGPAYRRRRTRDLLVEGLRHARHEVFLASPYLAPGRRVLAALEDAGRRGVRVRLLLAGARSDHPVLWRAAHALVPRLASGGVQVSEYEGSMMHAKMALFDGKRAIVGTSNLDRQSFEHSYEVNLVLEGEDVTRSIREMFQRDLDRSQRVDPEWLARRGLLQRVLDRLSALLLRLI